MIQYPVIDSWFADAFGLSMRSKIIRARYRFSVLDFRGL
ncbi:hypothetical protein C4J99_1492 [Pseudomonas synxantha]|nr:hypothetical protein C4J99_1492 [Pseudomonas synxantha]